MPGGFRCTFPPSLHTIASVVHTQFEAWQHDIEKRVTFDKPNILQLIDNSAVRNTHLRNDHV